MKEPTDTSTLLHDDAEKNFMLPITEVFSGRPPHNGKNSSYIPPEEELDSKRLKCDWDLRISRTKIILGCVLVFNLLYSAMWSQSIIAVASSVTVCMVGGLALSKQNNSVILTVFIIMTIIIIGINIAVLVIIFVMGAPIVAFLIPGSTPLVTGIMETVLLFVSLIVALLLRYYVFKGRATSAESGSIIVNEHTALIREGQRNPETLA